MSLQIDLPLGYVFRACINDVDLNVVGVSSDNEDSCTGCIFKGSKALGDCPLACCKQDRADKKNCVFVEVAWEGGIE